MAFIGILIIDIVLLWMLAAVFAVIFAIVRLIAGRKRKRKG